jgi:hypothetical protein
VQIRWHLGTISRTQSQRARTVKEVSIDEEEQVAGEEACSRQDEGGNRHTGEEAGEDGSPAEAGVAPPTPTRTFVIVR